MLSHQTAAEVCELGLLRGGPVELMCTTTGGRRRSGVRLHRAQLVPAEVTAVRGMPVTTPERTVLDLAARLSDRGVERLLDRGEARRLLDLRHCRT